MHRSFLFKWNAVFHLNAQEISEPRGSISFLSERVQTFKQLGQLWAYQRVQTGPLPNL